MTSFIHLAALSTFLLGTTPSPSAQPSLPPAAASTEPLQYIQTNCSKCRRASLAIWALSTGETQAVLSLTYYDENQSEFVGSLAVTLQLADGTEAVVDIDGVWLTQGEEAGWVLEQSPDAWTWDDVESADVGFVPG